MGILDRVITMISGRRCVVCGTKTTRKGYFFERQSTRPLTQGLPPDKPPWRPAKLEHEPLCSSVLCLDTRRKSRCE
jgi:hypothetical protein